MDLFDLFAKISLDKSDYDEGVKEATSSGENLASKLGSGLATAGRVAAKGLAVIGTASTAVVGGLLALESSTEEYRIAQGKLNTAFEAAGYSADTAQQAYNGFYEILGDTDTATEASQLLAKLAESEEDVSTWTKIAAGVSGTFGDSLPIEGLIEASNETAKVGQVTGVLADALNWAGISEDEFNAKLAACGSESERNQLIMNTLSGTYDEASEAFYRNNEAVVEARKNQAQMDATLAKLGKTVSDTKNALVSEFLPGISEVAEAFSGIITGTEGADEAFSEAVSGLIAQAAEKLPEFLNFGVQILTALINGIIQSLPTLAAAIPQVITSVANALSELLPQILDAGMQILIMLADGIIAAIPQMTERLPQIIENIVLFLTNNLPILIDKGIEMLMSLTDGIVNAIPGLVERLPQIITAIVQFIANNLPKILQAGVDILSKLISGIIQSIPQLVSVLPQIINAIVDGIDALMGSIVEIGGNIVNGIWEGIKNAAGWLKDQVVGFFGGIVDGAKQFLGIASPSKLFAEMGQNMALGVGAGWDDEFGTIKKDIESGMNFDAPSIGISAQYGAGRSTAGRKAWGAGNSLPIFNITINGAKYSDENALVQRIMREIQFAASRKEAVHS